MTKGFIACERLWEVALCRLKVGATEASKAAWLCQRQRELGHWAVSTAALRDRREMGWGTHVCRFSITNGLVVAAQQDISSGIQCGEGRQTIPPVTSDCDLMTS